MTPEMKVLQAVANKADARVRALRAELQAAELEADQANGDVMRHYRTHPTERDDDGA